VADGRRWPSRHGARRRQLPCAPSWRVCWRSEALWIDPRHDPDVENRRRAAARTRLGEDLALLDRRSWHVERDVTVAGVTLPFVVFGPRGLFALTSSHGWAMSDLTVLDGAAGQLAAVLPAYLDPVRAAICLPYDPAVPRSWFNEQGAGGWILGGGHLLEFLEHFDDHGFSRSDIEVLRARSTPRGPTKPLIHLPQQPLLG